MLAAMRIEHRRLVLNGVTTYVEDMGEGPPLVIVHGWAAGRVLWKPHQRALCAHRRAITYDLRGHGDAGKSASVAYTISQFADDLRALLDALGLARASLLGHSLGGMICLEFALTHPTRVERLILSGTSLGQGDVESPASRDMLDMLRDGGYADFIEFGADLWFHGPVPQATIDLAVVAARRCPDVVALAAMEGLLAWTARDRIGGVTVPALVVAGAEDATQPATAAQELADALPRGTLHFLPDVGHDCYLEAPAAYRAAVETFLNA